MIDSHKNWYALLRKESLKFRDMKPIINNGLKSQKNLTGFFKLIA